MRSFGIDNNQGVHPRITYKQLRKSIQITPLPMAMMSVTQRAKNAVRKLLSEKKIQPMSNIRHRSSLRFRCTKQSGQVFTQIQAFQIVVFFECHFFFYSVVNHTPLHIFTKFGQLFARDSCP